MDTINKPKRKFPRILKIIGFVVLAVIALAFLAMTMTWFGGFNSFRFSTSQGLMSSDMAMPMATPSFDGAYIPEYGRENTSADSWALRDEGSRGEAGSTAEDFEARNYSAYIRARHLESACKTISDLKPLDYVIFESATEGSDSCYYTFRVTNAKVSEVVAVIESLKPDNFSENIYTIKREIEGYTSEKEILEQKIKAIEETLESALKAYSEVTTLASNTNNADSLARVITSRVEVIERLTNERIKLSGQMERLLRAQAEASEKLDHAEFSVRIFDAKYFDGKQLADSWQDALRRFFVDANRGLQNATIGLISFVILLVPLILYTLIILIVTRFLFRFARSIWRK